MRQINKEEILGKKITGWWFDADYITLEFDDNTFCFLSYDFDYESYEGAWYDVNIEHMIDKDGFIKDEFAPRYFELNSNGEPEADGMLEGPSMLNIIRWNDNAIKSILENNKKIQKTKQKNSFIELAKEFGIELTEEQSEKLYKEINGEK
jgi:hypothetical protein